MKKYFKIGIGTIIPTALVFMVLNWLYGWIDSIVVMILPNTMEYQWWYVFPFIVAIVILVFIIGVGFSFIRPIRWGKKQFEKVVKRVPVVGAIYKFGNEIVDSFVTDVNEDGDLQVIEIEFGGLLSLGVLTDEEHSLGFLLSAPSPVTGYVFKLPNYRKLDMTFMEAVKINTSLGKIGGFAWTEEE